MEASLLERTPEMKRLRRELHLTGFSSVDAYLASGWPLPHGTVIKTIKSSGGDYSSIANWEAALTADPTEAQTASVEDDFNAQSSSCTIDVSNTNNVDLTVTVASANRWYQDSHHVARSWDAKAYVSTGTDPVINVDTVHVILEYLASHQTSTANQNFGLTTNSNSTTIRFCILKGGERAIQGNISAGNSALVYRCAFWGMRTGPIIFNGTMDLYHCTSVGASLNYGFQQYSGVMNCYSCISLDNASADYDNGVNVTTCISSDGTGGDDSAVAWSSSTTYAKGDVCTYGGETWLSRQGSNLNNTPAAGAWWEQLTNRDAYAITRNPSKHMEDLRPVVDRAWPDGINWACGFEETNLDAWTIYEDDTGAQSVTSVAAHRGDYGYQIDIPSGAGTNRASIEDLPELADGYVFFKIKLDSAFTMADGDLFEFAIFQSNSSVILRLKNTAGTYYLDFCPKNPVHADTVAINKGTWYCVKLRRKQDATTGVQAGWYKEAGAASWTLVAEYTGQDTSLYGIGDLVRFGTNYGIDAGTSGKVYVDDVIVSESDIDEPDSNSPYGDSMDGHAEGADYSSTIGSTDIVAETVSDWDIGAFEIPTAGGGGITLYQVEKAHSRGSCIGVMRGVA